MSQPFYDNNYINPWLQSTYNLKNNSHPFFLKQILSVYKPKESSFSWKSKTFTIVSLHLTLQDGVPLV